MGCPVQKVFKNGEGSALLSNIPLAAKIVEECVKSGKIITVKMRQGVKRGERTAIELAKAVEEAGASLVTVHGRSRDDFYSGDVDFELIGEIKQNAHIPVIANGGVFSVEDATRLMKNTGADGVMLARGAIENPLLFSMILGRKPEELDKKKLINRHIDLLLQDMPEKNAIVYMRKQLARYVHGIRNSKQAKLKIFAATTADEVREIISSLEF
jgi:nifR3 family TIM-barrel protein